MTSRPESTREICDGGRCVLCAREVSHGIGLWSHFRKHIRDGSLYEHNKPREAGS